MKLVSQLAALALLVAPAPPAVADEVLRAFFTSGPQGSEREPVDTLRTASANRRGVYFFSEIEGMRGEWVVHRWEYAGTVQFEVPFRVRSDRWSAYSYKKLEPSVAGRWTVKVVDERGRVLASSSLVFAGGAPPSTPPVATTVTPDSPAPEPDAAAPEPSRATPEASPEAAPPPTPPAPTIPAPDSPAPEPDVAAPEPSRATPEASPEAAPPPAEAGTPIPEVPSSDSSTARRRFGQSPPS